jgi:CMP-2-keto-3-deoxyoctulosonic acid synthetase
MVKPSEVSKNTVGSDRIAEAVSESSVEIVVNVQEMSLIDIQSL